MNVLRTLRNNWKKSVFLGGLVSYGAAYGHEQYRINQLMREVCAEAVEYGRQIILPESNNRRVVVLLNPTANKRSAESSFEKYCAPILHLAGIRVDIIKTESEGFARSYVESELQEMPDAILVAGGDGTLMEVVTGVMRRDPTASCPIGILPVGRTNSVAAGLFPQKPDDIDKVHALTKAALAIVRGQMTKRDVLQIEALPTDHRDVPSADSSSPETEVVKKPIYAMANIKVGAFRNAMTLRDKYWYFGGLRERAAILFNVFKSMAYDCGGSLKVTPPCSGCSSCYLDRSAKKVEYKSKNWWSFMLPTSRDKDAAQQFLVDGVDLRTRVNPECGVVREIPLDNTNELYLTTMNVEPGPAENPCVRVRKSSSDVGAFDWILDSWRRLSDDQHLNSQLLSDAIECRTVELIPAEKTHTNGAEEFYSIDNEDFEVKPIRVTLLPGRINVFTFG